ncbi:MAG: hypothetical protein PHE68_04200 [Candidatus Peribacteraceae bacterium]|nr:hypothetical protein [Candidatus Peribacteraceae bacterium]MDD5074680.1 hypothetical protein [Candidatus Peribacteraceae bacterium]
MAKTASPEAEPKNPAEGGGETDEKKKEKEKPKEKEKGGDDGAMTPVSHAQKQKIIDEYLKEQQGSRENTRESEDDVEASLWRTSRETVREPLGNIFKYGSIAAAPVPAAIIWGGDKLARNTISKIPAVGQVYEIPRAIITGTATKVRNLLSGVLTLPALPVDFAGNMIQGFSKRMKSEEKGFVGRLTERTAEKLGWVIGKGYDVGEKIVKLGAGFVKGTFETILKATVGAVKIPYNVTQGAFGLTSEVAKTGFKMGGKSLAGVAASVGTVAFIGWLATSLGVNWGVLPAAWASGYWPAVWTAVKWPMMQLWGAAFGG